MTENSDETWSIGYPLLKKYQFVFNQDSRTVGFYNPNLPKDKGDDEQSDSETDDEEEGEKKSDESDKKNKDTENKVNNSGLSAEIIILIICGSGIVFIVIGILIGKFVFKKMKGKKRVNELEENFDYFDGQGNTINE